MNRIKAGCAAGLQLTGVRYAIALFMGLGVALLLAKQLGISDPMWLLISAIISTDVDRKQIRKIVWNRTLSTVLGVMVAIVCLLIWGPGYGSTLVGMVLLMVLCHSVPMLFEGWRVTMITGVIVLAPGLQGASVDFGEHMATKRATEAIAGCLIAGIISLAWGKVWERLDAKVAAHTGND